MTVSNKGMLDSVVGCMHLSTPTPSLFDEEQPCPGGLMQCRMTFHLCPETTEKQKTGFLGITPMEGYAIGELTRKH